MANKRRFINFTKEELTIMQNALGKDNKSLCKEIQEELKTREYNQKRYEEWAKEKPKIYTC